MIPEVATLIQECAWFPSNYLVFSDNVFAPLIYYSHLGALIPTIIIALFIFLNQKKELSNILLLLTTSCFSVWIFSDLVLWTNESPALVMFFWTIEIIVEPLVYFFALYLAQVFIFKKDFSSLQKAGLLLPLLPTFAFASTSLGLLGFDISNCDRAAAEGVLATYGYGIEILYVACIGFLTLWGWLRIKDENQKKQGALLAAGIVFFLLSFSLGNVVEVFTENWYIGQIGLFGAPVFTALLAYLIVRYRAFNAKLIGAQVLVTGLWLSVFSLLFIRTVDNIRIITGITLIFVLIAGAYLVRSVQREITQREHIEKLAKELEIANKQQVTLIHFITHQIKGFLTKSRNIFAGISEGDYGVMPDTMKEIVRMGFESDTKGVDTIQEILGAANIKSGKVTYTMSDFNLKTLIEEITEGLKSAAEAKGLAFTVDIAEGPFTINGDRGQLINVFKNLIDNSVKYTLAGSVAVSLSRDSSKAVFKIQDTGVGITPEDMAHLFTEGGHGKESQKVNTESTGFGLYIVKNIVEAHKGKVWAESEGAGKGSRFIVELPAK